MADIILKNAVVITMDENHRVLENGGVVITGNQIDFVGDSKEIEQKYSAEKTIDCKHHIIMPGLIDAHGHAGHSFTRFVVKDTQYWMPAMTHMYKHYVDDDFWYVEGKLSALQRLQSGVTTGVCVMGSQPRCDDPIFAINNAKAYHEIGVRDIVCTGPCHTPWPHNFSRWKNGVRERKTVSFDQVCDSLEQVIQTLNHTNDDMTMAYVTPFGLVTSINPSGATTLDTLTQLTEHDIIQAKAMRKIADKYHARIHTDCFGGMIQLASQDPESMLLGPDVHIQHCSFLSDHEIEILAKTGAHAAAAPGSKAPVHKMLDAGINIVVTTDGPRIQYDLDLFGAMRMFQLNYRNMANDMTLLPPEKLLEMVTINAAKAIGLDHMIGSLEKGKRADLITIDTQNPRLTPMYNPVHMIALSVNPSDINHVIVNGKLLVQDGRALYVDQKQLFSQAQEMSDEINQRAHFEKFEKRLPLNWGNNRVDLSEEPYDLEWQRQDGGHY